VRLKPPGFPPRSPLFLNSVEIDRLLLLQAASSSAIRSSSDHLSGSGRVPFLDPPPPIRILTPDFFERRGPLFFQSCRDAQGSLMARGTLTFPGPRCSSELRRHFVLAVVFPWFFPLRLPVKSFPLSVLGPTWV